MSMLYVVFGEELMEWDLTGLSAVVDVQMKR